MTKLCLLNKTSGTNSILLGTVVKVYFIISSNYVWMGMWLKSPSSLPSCAGTQESVTVEKNTHLCYNLYLR